MHNLALINNLFCKVVLFIFMKILIKKAKTTIFFVKQSLLFFNSSGRYCSFYWELVLFEYVQQAKSRRI